MRPQICCIRTLNTAAKALQKAGITPCHPPGRKTVLNLLRALLRECTYLPDPAAREYLHNHILFRFRQYCPRPNPRTRQGPRIKPAVVERLPSLLRDARSELRLLERANQGHPEHLQKVLAITYGRRGKRKHQLLLELKSQKISPHNKAAVGVNSSIGSGIPQVTDQLRALIKSQKSQKTMGFDRGPTAKLHPRIEEKSIWGRPMPQSRANNIIKFWWASTLDAVMPPLPEDEWQKLEGLATGRIQWDGPVPRRKGQILLDNLDPGDQKYDPVSESWSGQLPYKAPPAGHVNRPELQNKVIKTNPHNLTGRHMRSHWATVFSKCPVMRWDESRSRWNVQWGSAHNGREIVLSEKQALHSSVFEGLDESGKPLNIDFHELGYIRT